nr:MAG TPA: hypothetical protein [Caudoviricetes sp.]
MLAVQILSPSERNGLLLFFLLRRFLRCSDSSCRTLLIFYLPTLRDRYRFLSIQAVSPKPLAAG